MKAGIFIDGWKLPIFRRHFSQAGYAVALRPGLSSSTIMLTIKTPNMQALDIVVRAANDEAERTGPPQ